MKERTDRIAALLEKHLRKVLTSEEQLELDAWLAESSENRKTFAALTDTDQLLERLRIVDLADRDAIWEQTMRKIGVDQGAQVVSLPGKKTAWYAGRSLALRYAAAAVVILAVSTGVYLVTHNQPNSPDQANAQHESVPVATDAVVPGGEYAVLTLDDGSRIQLDKAPDGDLTQQGSMKLAKVNGHLTYSGRFITSGPVSTGAEKHASLHNMVSTPRGGQYQITLPDGSKVWLNAASSLRFPLAFAGNQRVVELTGEAYFEIKKLSLPGSNSRMPFIVKMTGKHQGTEVEVLGTHFNVKAYDDENDVSTTLLEGSVKVRKGNLAKIITPDEQAVSQNGEIAVKQVNAASYAKWKDGMFYLTGTTESIMNQIARWYKVDVVYEGKASVNKSTESGIFATIPRDQTYEQMLKILETQNIFTRPEGRKLFVRQ